jgi:hypothetical protein
LSEKPAEARSLVRRVGWFAGLWLAGVAAILAVSLVAKVVLRAIAG